MTGDIQMYRPRLRRRCCHRDVPRRRHRTDELLDRTTPHLVGKVVAIVGSEHLRQLRASSEMRIGLRLRADRNRNVNGSITIGIHTTYQKSPKV